MAYDPFSRYFPFKYSNYTELLVIIIQIVSYLNCYVTTIYTLG